jgi:hypothetical protein
MLESYPSSVWLREPIEAYVLKIRDPNTNQLKPPADWVGTYTLPGGQKIPAVYVVGANMVPSDWIIEGIECAINEVPEIAPIASTINGVIDSQSIGCEARACKGIDQIGGAIL